LRFWQECPS